MLSCEAIGQCPMRCAAAIAAEVEVYGGFVAINTSVALCVTADIDLGWVVIAPQHAVARTERTVAVVDIIGLVRNDDMHRAAVASAIVRDGGCGFAGHVAQSIRAQAQSQASPIGAAAITVGIIVEPR